MARVLTRANPFAPQLFINYRLKSVAHLPWKFFMYKALNTFIDDLFAFIIKMPTLHRMSCFRDDLVFIVFLYQRWIYKVPGSLSGVGAGALDLCVVYAHGSCSLMGPCSLMAGGYVQSQRVWSSRCR